MKQEEKEKSSWGPIFSGRWKESEEDEIDKLIAKQKAIKTEPMPLDIPISDWKADKAKREADLERQIWNLLSIEAQKKMYKETS